VKAYFIELFTMKDQPLMIWNNASKLWTAIIKLDSYLPGRIAFSAVVNHRW